MLWTVAAVSLAAAYCIGHTYSFEYGMIAYPVFAALIFMPWFYFQKKKAFVAVVEENVEEKAEAVNNWRYTNRLPSSRFYLYVSDYFLSAELRLLDAFWVEAAVGVYRDDVTLVNKHRGKDRVASF